MNVPIIGAGIAGLAAAIALKRVGIQATIYEAAPEILPVGAGLGLAPNALSALQAIGLYDQVAAMSNTLPWLNILDEKGNTIVSTDNTAMQSRYGYPNVSIHRSTLHNILLQALDRDQVVTGKKAKDIRVDKGQHYIHFEDGTIIKSEYLLIADGIHSTLRNYFAPHAKLVYAGYTCWRGLITGTSHCPIGASETWAQEGRFGIVPLANNDIYWFACIKAKANTEIYRSFTPADLQLRFRNFHAPVLEVLSAASTTAFVQHDIYDLQPLSHFAYGNALLIGDAAHATTPNMAQGACQGLEDAATLLNSIKCTTSVSDAFKLFEKKRLKKTSAIIHQSRKIGKIAQLENPFLITLRNCIMKQVPATFHQKQADKVYRTHFA